jgi:hypothetical protein
MDTNQPVMPPNPIQSPPPVPTATMTGAPSAPEPKKSNKGLLIVLAVVLVALTVLGGVTFWALQSSSSETVTTAPTPAVTQTPTPAEADSLDTIQKDLNETTVTDPSSEVDSLQTDINKL